MKRVNYPGGVATFAIPANWIEGADTEAETSVFYDAASDTGILGLYVQ